MTSDEIAKKYNLNGIEEIREAYRNNSVENMEAFNERITKAYNEVKEKYK